MLIPAPFFSSSVARITLCGGVLNHSEKVDVTSLLEVPLSKHREGLTRAVSRSGCAVLLAFSQYKFATKNTWPHPLLERSFECSRDEAANNADTGSLLSGILCSDAPALCFCTLRWPPTLGEQENIDSALRVDLIRMSPPGISVREGNCVR